MANSMSYLSGLLAQANTLYNKSKEYNRALLDNQYYKSNQQAIKSNTLSSIYSTTRKNKTRAESTANAPPSTNKTFNILKLLTQAKEAISSNNKKQQAVGNNQQSGMAAFTSTIKGNEQAQKAMIQSNLKLRQDAYDKAYNVIGKLKISPAHIELYQKQFRNLNPRPTENDVGYLTGNFKPLTGIKIPVRTAGGYSMVNMFASQSKYYTDLKDAYDANLSMNKAKMDWLGTGNLSLYNNLNTQQKEIKDILSQHELAYGKDYSLFSDEQLANVNWNGVRQLSDAYQKAAKERDDILSTVSAKTPLSFAKKTRLDIILKNLTTTNKAIATESAKALANSKVTTQAVKDLEQAQIAKLSDIDVALKVQEAQNKTLSDKAKVSTKTSVSSIKDIINTRASLIDDSVKKKRLSTTVEDPIDTRPI